MTERNFVDALIETIQSFQGATTLRPSDNHTLGIPDILGWVPVACVPQDGFPLVWAVALEAKSLRPLMEDPFHKGRRTGQMLKHPFTGPQISKLRELKLAGVEAFGIVRASDDTAFRIEPEDLPRRTGNFTHEELVKFGTAVSRTKGLWKFWRNPIEIPGSRHRDNSM